MIKITTYQPNHRDAVVELITTIQQVEFRVPITLADQPDLSDIENYYQKNKGNFWVALNEDEDVVGSIALIDNNQPFGTIRKMFVQAAYRGRPFGIAASLLTTLEQAAKENNMTALYLGTLDRLYAARAFYEKNEYEEIPENSLPTHFPRMMVDNTFYRKQLSTWA